ncbi:MAG: methyltransferase domain-containing protein [Planctomycetota bacterium]|nr:methyltransferase domain-containing protein [Planctomycetota bacterium]
MTTVATLCPFDRTVMQTQMPETGEVCWVCPTCLFRSLDEPHLSRNDLGVTRSGAMTEAPAAGPHGARLRRWLGAVGARVLGQSRIQSYRSRDDRTVAARLTLDAPKSTSVPEWGTSDLDPATHTPASSSTGAAAERIELFYDSIAERFDDIMNLYDMRRRVSIVFDVFFRDHDLAGRKLLDAGCGTGWFTLRAHERGADVTALDIGPKLLEQVRRKCKAKTVCGDVLDLEFGDDSFDVVVSSECIEHTRRPQDAVRELIRVCRPGGLIAITSNNHIWYWLCALADKFDARPYKGIENWPRWSELRDWVERENVRILDRRGIHLFPFQVRLFQPILKIMDRFGRRLGPLCVNQAILAIKQC